MDQEKISPKKSFKEISDKVVKIYDNFVIENVNDHCIRMSVFKGDYKWHYHNNTDELFVVLEGELTIEIRDDETVLLQPGEFLTIPAKTIHRTSAAVRTVNLCFEKNSEDTIFVD